MTNTNHDGPMDLAQEFERLANERESAFEALEAEHEPGVKVAEE